MNIPNHDTRLLPDDPTPIGPCFHCPGECSVEDHWEDVETDERGCEKHTDCTSFVEYTAEQRREDIELERAEL